MVLPVSAWTQTLHEHRRCMNTGVDESMDISGFQKGDPRSTCLEANPSTSPPVTVHELSRSLGFALTADVKRWVPEELWQRIVAFALLSSRATTACVSRAHLQLITTERTCAEAMRRVIVVGECGKGLAWTFTELSSVHLLLVSMFSCTCKGRL